MTTQELSGLIACFEQSSARSMKLTTKEFSLELSREGTGNAVSAIPAVPAAEAAPSAEPSGSLIRSPLVGTYHAAPGAGQPPLAAVGDRVQKGQTVCLIEAMKMMSEITAPCDCVIEELLQQDGALVAFEEPLLRYRETC